MANVVAVVETDGSYRPRKRNHLSDPKETVMRLCGFLVKRLKRLRWPDSLESNFPQNFRGLSTKKPFANDPISELLNIWAMPPVRLGLSGRISRKKFRKDPGNALRAFKAFEGSRA